MAEEKLESNHITFAFLADLPVFIGLVEKIESETRALEDEFSGEFLT